MDLTQEMLDVLLSTPMTAREARVFVLALDSWQKRDNLTDAQRNACKQAAIEAAYAGGIYGPIDTLMTMYALTKTWGK